MARTILPASRSLSTAERRRPEVVDAAVRAFARTGYRGTTVADVATEAGISPAYVFRLFGDKQTLFIAALRHCFEQVHRVLEAGAGQAAASRPEDVLAAMSVAYARLIADRKLLMIQIHALAAGDEPAVREALRDGYRTVTEFVAERSGASEGAVQNFFALGQLCHMVTALGLIDDEGVGAQTWARTLSAGLQHFLPDTPSPG